MAWSPSPGDGASPSVEDASNTSSAGAVSAAFAWPTGPPADARAVFEALHRNLYRAFEADTEDEIYDVLKQSVDASLLQEVYLDIYESLILREQQCPLPSRFSGSFPGPSGSDPA